MTSATPKPRAGEHTIERWNGWELERDDKGPFVQVRDYEALRAERDLLRERERELVEALEMAAHFLKPRGAIASLAPGSDASHLHRKLHALLAKHGR